MWKIFLLERNNRSALERSKKGINKRIDVEPKEIIKCIDLD